MLYDWKESLFQTMSRSIKKAVNVPNTLTALRIVLIWPLVVFLLNDNYLMAGVVVLASAVTDMFDGLIARKFNQITDIGKVLDPIADKLTLMAVVICVNLIYPDIRPFVLVLFTKELMMLFGGAFLLRVKIKPPAARWFGKVSTVVFYTSVTVLILLKAIWGYTDQTLTTVLLSITTASMLFSLVRYTVMFMGLVREKDEERKMEEKLKDRNSQNSDE